MILNLPTLARVAPVDRHVAEWVSIKKLNNNNIFRKAYNARMRDAGTI